MLKIYGGDLSSPANKVRFIANYIGLEYHYVQVKIREGENREEAFLNINPFGKIPCIDDDGFYLFESNAIGRYLCDKHQSDLYPKELKARARVEQWMDFATIHINGAMGRILFNKVFAGFAGVSKDERSLEDGIKFLKKYLPTVDTNLGKTKYIAGDTISLADMALLSSLDPADIVEFDLSVYSNVEKYRAILKRQDFYRQCFADYGEPIRRMLHGKE